ncbi:hypothetical protein L1987_60355 [Smallanthus sonchifolius]|uniref:Uncharacterized protein n=1 Tax=Smallanthus sonchifolius TaxID=185202 RepID=A0ACB9D883_9ASTR|nr:hypothetical protein L1987_60355 [Smallanthus sonchifolius]
MAGNSHLKWQEIHGGTLGSAVAGPVGKSWLAGSMNPLRSGLKPSPAAASTSCRRLSWTLSTCRLENHQLPSSSLPKTTTTHLDRPSVGVRRVERSGLAVASAHVESGRCRVSWLLTVAIHHRRSPINLDLKDSLATVTSCSHQNKGSSREPQATTPSSSVAPLPP